jgi:hypothetical protein
MPLLFGDLKTNLAKFAGDGAGDDAGRGRSVNQAVERLMTCEQWTSLSTRMRMLVIDTVFPLPANVEAILGATIDGVPAQIYGTEYQFIANGPGDLDCWTDEYPGTVPFYRTGDGPRNGLCDAGHDHATMFDIPLDSDKYRLVAFSTSSSDVGKVVRVQGFGTRNEELREELQVNRWAEGIEGAVAGDIGGQVKISTSLWRKINRVILPTGQAGYISLYAVVPSTSEMRFLGKYHPSFRIPTFRRYRFTTGLDFDSGSATVLANVKLKYLPFVDNYDVIPLDSEQAVRDMMLAIRAEESGDLEQAIQYELMAKKILSECQGSRETGRGVPVMIGSNPATMLGRYGRRFQNF